MTHADDVENPLSEQTRFLIDFNVHAVASALGLPIPEPATALMYGISSADLVRYQAQIDAELAKRAQAYAQHAGIRALLASHAQRILCIGDSITTYRRSYARLLQQALAGQGVEVLNGAFSGYTSNQGLELTYTQFLHHQADWVLMKYGVNDAKQFGGHEARPLVSPDEYADNLHSMVKAFQAHNSARLVLLTPTPVVESIVNQIADIMAMRLTWDNQRLSHYADLTQQVAEQMGALSVDLRHALGNPPDSQLYCADGLHPNAQGQVLIFERLLETLANM